jgi:CBS domain-containing protein
LQRDETIRPASHCPSSHRNGSVAIFFREDGMKISECMSVDVELAAPTDSVRDVANLMRRLDIGSLPVGENDRLVGMITDRDIVMRAVAEGKGPDTPVREVMSSEIRYCFEDEDVEAVSEQMGEWKIRRLPVLNRDKRLVGIVSLGDVSHSDGADGVLSGRALREISEPGGLHSQQ